MYCDVVVQRIGMKCAGIVGCAYRQYNVWTKSAAKVANFTPLPSPAHPRFNTVH